MDYGKRMDEECIKLCDALNALPDIKTWFSCCGHGRRFFEVVFEATHDALLLIFEAIKQSESNWKIEVCRSIDFDQTCRIMYKLRVIAMGEVAYKKANELASVLNSFTI